MGSCSTALVDDDDDSEDEEEDEDATHAAMHAAAAAMSDLGAGGEWCTHGGLGAHACVLRVCVERVGPFCGLVYPWVAIPRPLPRTSSSLATCGVQSRLPPVAGRGYEDRRAAPRGYVAMGALVCESHPPASS